MKKIILFASTIGLTTITFSCSKQSMQEMEILSQKDTSGPTWYPFHCVIFESEVHGTECDVSSLDNCFESLTCSANNGVGQLLLSEYTVEELVLLEGKEVTNEKVLKLLKENNVIKY